MRGGPSVLGERGGVGNKLGGRFCATFLHSLFYSQRSRFIFKTKRKIEGNWEGMLLRREDAVKKRLLKEPRSAQASS